ncbi:DUF2255 family protein [Streptomyces sp. NPDC056660]|uniref:DUF2255 family protein n=1 Tax=Streptomyces sp. NPDC056660 TaxID=3345897 RepID=UPI00367D8151
MSTWDQAQPRALAAADDLHISPYREDGRTYGTPTWIRSVVVAGDLYVRPLQRPQLPLVPGGAVTPAEPAG